MTTTGRTRAELAAWLDRWNENGAAPSAETVADFLGIELAPEPMFPVGQRRRSPGGVEVVKTDDGMTDPWRRYRGKPGPNWFTDAEVADWEVITDASECDREHLPSHSVRICLATLSDEFIADLARGAGSPSGPVADAAHRESARRLRLQRPRSRWVVVTRFTVYVPYIVTLAVRGVEAEDEDDALNKVEGHASLCAYCSDELDLSPDANWEDATAEEEMA